MTPLAPLWLPHRRLSWARAGKTVKMSKETATEVGREIARRMKEKDIEAAVFDRNGYLYHGRIKALAEGAREEGLKF